MGCREGSGIFDLDLVIGGRERTGPSQCMQDFFITPVELIVVGVMLYYRVQALLELPPASDGQNVFLRLGVLDKAQFLFAGLLLAQPLFSLILIDSDDDGSDATIYNLQLLVMWFATLVVMMLETYRSQVRCSELKSFWVGDWFVRLLRFRIALLHMYFGEDAKMQNGTLVEIENHTDDDRATEDMWGFLLSTGIVVCALLQKPKQVKFTGENYGKMADDGEEAVNPNRWEGKGEENASWFSSFTFEWVTHVLNTGMTKQLGDEDLHPLMNADTSAETGRKLQEQWNVEINQMPDNPSMLGVMWRVFRRNFLVSGLYKLLNDTVVFVGPLLLQALIQYVEKGGAGETTYALDGILLAVGIFLAKTVESFAMGQYFHMGYRIGGQVRAGMTMMVYRKAFLLSSASRQGFKLGELVSLMSVDAQRLAMAAPYIHLMWSAPLQLIVSTILLYNLVGASVFGGLALMIVMIPVNTWIAKKQTHLSKEIMRIKDERSNVMDEVLQGIRIIKYFAWEQSFIAKVQEIREREVALIWKNAQWGILSVFLWGGAPMLVALITFIFYAAGGNELRPNIAFTALALFNVMRFPLNMISMIINLIIQSQVAIDRLRDYLMAEDVDRQYYANCDTSAEAATGIAMSRKDVDDSRAVEIVDGRFSWPKAMEKPKEDEKSVSGIMQMLGLKKKEAARVKLDRVRAMQEFNVVLRDVSLKVEQGELVGVAGKVGGGKTSLLSAILGDMRKDSGSVVVSGRVAYAAQQPWIVNATMRDNILFGAEFDEEKYSEVLAACALLPDLEVLPAGDMTEIGEKGINLSGGQKARISLARAVYQDADVYLLDDPLSAVDVHVSKHMFEECIQGYLADKTRVLVTHQIQYLPLCDRVIYLQDSRIAAAGPFSAVAAAHPHLHGDGGGGDTPASKAAEGAASPVAAAGRAAKKKGMARSNSRPTLKQSVSALTDTSTGGGDAGKTTTKESRKAGTVPLKVWVAFATSLTWAYVVLIGVAYIGAQAMQLASDWWLSVWSTAAVEREGLIEEVEEQGFGEEPAPVDTGFYLTVYGLLTILACASVAVRGAVVMVAVIRSAVTMHDRMLDCVLRAPVRFFDTTPMGRILNRFASDQYTLDNELRQTLSMMLVCAMSVFFVGVTILWVTPAFVVVMLPLGYVYVKVQAFFRQSSREMKRLESVAKSPIFAHFSETLNGVSTIRAFGAQDQFLTGSRRLNDAFSRAYFDNNAANRWLGVRLEFIGNAAVGCAALLAVMSKGDDPATAGLIGLSITYALSVTGTLNFMIRTFTQLESYMVAVERIEEYSDMAREAAPVIFSNRPPTSWPNQGRLTFDNVVMRYRADLEPALRGISFSTGAGEKIGVVGRTGAGKSTLAVALFRICELSEGKIELDGLDVSTIGLDDLRRQLSIIPQDPVLFSGTIRSNLDPFKEYSDDQLWEALEKVRMKEYIAATSDKLLHPVDEGGSNLSVGQRQLLCMARALLRKAKVIIMDEATASVDMETDSAIQETIREQFQHSTVITIAHRLATVMSCDKVMVLGEGRCLEMGPPKELMDKEDSIFHEMTSDHAAQQDMLN